MSDRLDTMGMLQATARLPEQITEAVTTAGDIGGLPDPAQLTNVLVLGMGNGGLVGEFLTVTAGPFMPLPVVVVKNYEPPSYVSERSLVFAISFSGDTEEIVQAATTAAAAGANIVALTTGGELAALAESWNAPVVRTDPAIPNERAAFGAMAAQALIVLEDLGLFPGASEWTRRAVEQLRRRRDELVADENDAALLARRIGRTIPIIYGAGGLGGVAARRWKTQMNENAKVPAFSGAIPELAHNEIAGWGQHGDLTRQMFTLVRLRHDHEHPQQMRGFELVTDLLTEVVVDVATVEANGDGPLAQMWDLMLFGDFCSLHAAFQEGLDPGPAPAISDVQARLRT